MKNSLETMNYYEEWKEKHLSSLHDEMDFTYNEMMLFAESYHRHRLESITEERIEEMANRCFPDIPHMGDLTMTNRIKWTGARKGMKALLDYLKQPR